MLTARLRNSAYGNGPIAHFVTGTKAIAQVGRNEALAAKAADDTARCTAWLLKFMQNDQPKFLTKAELCHAAMTELEVSKNSFNHAWISAIEQMGRHDWYEPLRRRYRTKS
jgi:hypothetical protein